jgi:phage shock protein C
MATKKLTRSTDKLLAGVCGGLAEYFEIDASMMRVLYAALTIFSAAFPGVLLYIIMAIIIPQKGVASTTVEDVEAEEVKTEKKTTKKKK